MDAHARAQRRRRIGEQRLDPFRKTDENDLERAFALQRRQGGRNGHGGPVIASHRIDGNRDRGAAHLSDRP